MAAKRNSRSSARKSGRKSARKSGRKPARKSTSKGTRRGSAKSRGLVTRAKRTARTVLFGTLGVAGYVGGIARRGRGRGKGGPGATSGGVKPIPDGYRTVTPYLVVPDVPRLIEFVQQAFGATELMRHLRPDGSVMHAEVQIGDSRVMMGETPPSAPSMPGCIHLYVVDADALYHLALQAGATSLREPTTQFYGDRMAGVQDPLGNQWWIATHVEDVSPVEMALRAATAQTGAASGI